MANGADDSSSTQPDSSYYSDHSVDFGGSSYDSDRYVVVDRAIAPIAAFRRKSDDRLVVITGSWSQDPTSYGTSNCDVELDVTEFSDRVVIEASVPITERDRDAGRTCPAPPAWTTTEKNRLL